MKAIPFLIIMCLLSCIGGLSLYWKTTSVGVKIGLVFGVMIVLVVMVLIILLWKVAERWWDYYWNSFKCKKCRKRYDDRWQTERGLCWYCKNGKTIKVEIKRPKVEPRVVNLFTCPECKQVFKVDMRDKNGKCKICNEL